MSADTAEKPGVLIDADFDENLFSPGSLHTALTTSAPKSKTSGDPLRQNNGDTDTLLEVKLTPAPTPRGSDRPHYYPSSFENYLARTLCVGAVDIEPLYSAFLLGDATVAAKKAIEMFGAVVSDETKNVIYYLVLPFVVGNLISDMTSVDFLREGDELTAPSTNEEHRRALRERLLNYFLLTVAVLTLFPSGAAVDAIPVANALTGTPGIGSDIAKYATLGLVTTLGEIYYFIFNKKNVKNHTKEFWETLSNPKEFGRNLKRNPGRYLEVYIQTNTNSLYRGVILAYSALVVQEIVFGIARNNPYSRGISLTVGIAAFVFTMFSRFLPTRDKFLNKNFKHITDVELAKVPKFRKELIWDAVLSVARGVSTGVILEEIIPSISSSLPLSEAFKYWVGFTVGAAATAHSFYVRYYAGRDRAALEFVPKTKLIEKATATETTALVPVQKTDIEKAAEAFDKIAATHNSTGMNVAILFPNTMGRLVRFLFSFGTILTLSLLFLDNPLSNKLLIAITFLLGMEVFKNDGDVFGKAMKTTFQGMATKWELERENGDRGSWSCVSGNSLFRPLRVISKSPYDYSLPLLEKVAEEKNNLAVGKTNGHRV
jgi:hypothetical protein